MAIVVAIAARQRNGYRFAACAAIRCGPIANARATARQ